jgi:hypothetical protein
LFAATHNTDPPLNLPLPHHKPLPDTPEAGQIDPSLWLSPPGLIGSALNLIRPMVKGQRRTVWWSLLGTTLLFDTGAHAVQYRKICTQVLKSGCPNIVALDGSKLMVRDESQTPLPASLSPRRFPCCMAERARGGVAGERLRDGRRAAATTGAHGGGVRQCTSV